MKKRHLRKRQLIPWLILLLLFAGSLVAISFYGGTVSYSLFFAVLFIPVICLIYLLIVYLRFRIYQEIGSRTFVSGEPVSYFFTLQNEDRLAFSSVRVEFFSDFSRIEQLPDNPEYELLPGDRYTYETRIICRYRGEYEVGVSRVVMTDFLRLFRIPYRFPGTLRVTVLPKIVEINEMESIRKLMARLQREQSPDASEPDAVLRDYVPGDPEKRISWRMTARAGKLKVRNLLSEQQNGISILCDLARPDEETQAQYLPPENKLLELLIAIVLHTAERNIPSTVLYNGTQRKQKVQNIGGFEEFYRETASIVFGRTEEYAAFLQNPETVREIQRSRLLFMLSREMTKEFYGAAQDAVRAGHDVVIYLISDQEVPDFAVSEGERLLVVPIGAEQDLLEVL